MRRGQACGWDDAGMRMVGGMFVRQPRPCPAESTRQASDSRELSIQSKQSNFIDGGRGVG